MIAKFVTRSMQDVIDRLGGIPAFRIGTDPPPGLATEADVLRHRDSEDKRIYELVNGTLVEKPMGSPESLMGGFIHAKMLLHSLEHDLGRVLPGDGFLRVVAGNVRSPDVSFFSWKTLGDDEFPADAVCPFAPDLAVEVLSPSNTELEMAVKRTELFASGTRMMWIIDPAGQSASIYTSPSRFQIISGTDYLDAQRIMPGFRIALHEIFEHRKRSRKSRRTKPG
jgi:Uma2 family endonuclease